MSEPERSEESGSAASESPSVDRMRSRPLDRALVGSLPCIVCGYDLRGVSIRGMCPECGTAVRGTLLARIDPEAEELQPMCHPRLTGAGIVVWVMAGLAAILGCWAIRVNDVIQHGLGWHYSTGLGPEFVLVCGVLSALGVVGFVRPTRRTPLLHSVSAFGAFLACAPALLAFWNIQQLDRMYVTPYSFGSPVTVERELWRLLVCVSLAAVFLGVRPGARELVRRSLAMRTGRVDRQTLYAMVAAVAVSALGDTLRIGSTVVDGGLADAAAGLGSLLVLVGSLFLTMGMIAAAVDAWRIRQAILSPAPSLSQVLGERVAPS